MCVDNKRNYFIKVEKKNGGFPKLGRLQWEWRWRLVDEYIKLHSDNSKNVL